MALGGIVRKSEECCFLKEENSRERFCKGVLSREYSVEEGREVL